MLICLEQLRHKDLITITNRKVIVTHMFHTVELIVAGPVKLLLRIRLLIASAATENSTY